MNLATSSHCFWCWENRSQEDSPSKLVEAFSGLRVPLGSTRPVFAVALALVLGWVLLPLSSFGQSLVEDRFSGTRQVDNTSANFVSFAHDGTTELCFNSNTIAGDAELFCYDGSSVEQVAEINTRGSAAPEGFTVFDDGSGAKLYFSAVSGGDGKELHSYDGSTVQQVADLNTGSAGSNPYGFTVYNPGNAPERLYFSADDGSNGRELFGYDGSTVELIADVNDGSGDSNPSDFTTFFCGTKGTWLYFEATNGSDGDELFYYDGEQASFGQVADINSGSASSYPTYLTVADVGDGERLYFNASDGNNGFELHSYDCSSVSRETNINSGSGDALVNAITQYNDGSGDKLYFRADNGTKYGTYSYDSAGPTRIADISKAEGVVYDGTLYFKGTNGEGTELYEYGGSNVTQVKDINPGGADSDPMEHGYSTYRGSRAIYDPGSGSTLCFEAFDGEEDEQSARIRVLYTHDGSNTVRFQNTNSTVAGPATERKVVYDGTLYFSGSDEGEGNELYSYDGSSISQVADIYSGSKASSPDGFVVYDGGGGHKLYFAATDGAAGRELRRYDGTNVERVADVNSGSGDASPTRPVEFDAGSGAKLYFGATNGSGEVGLYKSDGSSATRVAKLDASSSERPPQDFALYDDGPGTALYFSAVGALYSYDGTSVTEISEVAPRSLETYDDGTGTKLYFSAEQGEGDQVPNIV